MKENTFCHRTCSTFGGLALSYQESAPLVPWNQQHALCIFASHFAKVPSAKKNKKQNR